MPTPPYTWRLSEHAYELDADGHHNLDDLTDVNVSTAPTTNDVLTWNGAAWVASAPSATGAAVKVSANDSTAGYLNGKLVAGTGVTLTENNGANETLTIAAPGAGAAFSGTLPYAISYGIVGTAMATTLNISPGTAWLVPILVPGPIRVRSWSYRALDASLARSGEIRLYKDVGTATLEYVAGTAVSDSFTAPASPATRVLPIASPPVVLDPGLYWAAIRCTGTNSLGIASSQLAASATGAIEYGTKPALGSTFDAVTGGSSSVLVAWLRLNASVFGQTTTF